MGLVSQYGFKINFLENPIFGSAAYVFVITLKFIFTTILEIKISGKKIRSFQNNFIN